MATDPNLRTSSEQIEILHPAVEVFLSREVNYRDILEDLPAAIYTTDADGRLTYFNKACIEFSGRVPTLGDDMWCVTWKLYTLAGDPLPHSECPMALALRQERPNRGLQAIAERPDGSRINFLPYPNPIFDGAGDLIGAVNMLVDLTDQQRAEEHLRVMAREVDHRANNLLAVMQSVLHLSKANSLNEYKEVVEGRLAALANVNNLIASAQWKSVDLKSLVERELNAFSDQHTIHGDALSMAPSAAQNFAMLIHELATNAIKYGALSHDDGLVAISWRLESNQDFVLIWTETRARKVSEIKTPGTGSSIIKAVARYLNGEIEREWNPSGLSLIFTCPRISLEAV